MGKINTNVETKIQIIERASHLFEEEEGKIEKVAEIAGKWFLIFMKTYFNRRFNLATP